jgi:hypothetical protein
MKTVSITLILVLSAMALAACAGQVASSAAQENTPAPVATGEAYTSTVLVTTYPNALPTSSQLELGTLELEGTPNAVTPAQAKTLLPLWQAIQSGALKSDAETNAVLKQIEEAMTPGQLAAIAALQLTFQDIGTYAQQNGLSLGFSPEALATRQASGGGQGGPGSFGNLSDQERAALRATAQAGGFGGAGGGENLTAEQRAALRATAARTDEFVHVFRPCRPLVGAKRR